MDFSFSEIALIAVIAYLVMGPEGFIEFTEKLGRWFGKVKTELNNFKVMAKEEFESSAEKRSESSHD